MSSTPHSPEWMLQAVEPNQKGRLTLKRKAKQTPNPNHIPNPSHEFPQSTPNKLGPGHIPLEASFHNDYVKHFPNVLRQNADDVRGAASTACGPLSVLLAACIP
eukprot:6076497-Amphidinium_carterae.1